MSAPQPVDVTGGSDGVAADCDAIVHVAGRFVGAGHDTLSTAAELHRVLAGEALSGSSLLDPLGSGEVSAALLWALDAPQGLSWAGTECTALGGELRAAAAAYATADRLANDARDVAAGLVGAGPATVDGTAVLVRTGDPVAAAQAVLADDPQLADVLVNALGLPALLTARAHDLPDGHAVVRATGPDEQGLAGVPPRSLADVLGELQQRDAGGRSGAIDVRIVTLVDGSRRVIIDVTGTKSWDPFPTSDVTSLTTNGRALVGERTAYEQGVLTALRRAGVRRRDPVMIVGHSQGGMVAVTAARDAVRSGEFDVTHVVTAGSPIGRTVGDVPGRVQVLALENAHDVVPHLDGRANPDRRNVTTVIGARGDGTVLDDHSLDDAYVPLVRDAQASDDRSIRQFLGGADDFFRGVRVRTYAFQVQRQY